MSVKTGSQNSTYLKPLLEVSSLEVVVSVGVKSKVDEEPGQCISIYVCTDTVLHATRKLLVVYNDRYENRKSMIELASSNNV